MTESPNPRPDQEGFGEASLGEAQSENPPTDPEYVEDHDDQDAEAPREDEAAEHDVQPDQAEG
jgi:hypothetical protein